MANTIIIQLIFKHLDWKQKQSHKMGKTMAIGNKSSDIVCVVYAVQRNLSGAIGLRLKSLKEEKTTASSKVLTTTLFGVVCNFSKWTSQQQKPLTCNKINEIVIVIECEWMHHITCFLNLNCRTNQKQKTLDSAIFSLFRTLHTFILAICYIFGCF